MARELDRFAIEVQHRRRAVRLMATTYARILARLRARPAERPRLSSRDHAAALLAAARRGF